MQHLKRPKVRQTFGTWLLVTNKRMDHLASSTQKLSGHYAVTRASRFTLAHIPAVGILYKAEAAVRATLVILVVGNLND